MSTGLSFLIRQRTLGSEQTGNVLRALATGLGISGISTVAATKTSTAKTAQPKKAKTAYQLFQSDPVLQKDLKGLAIGDRAKKTSEKWKTLTAEEKAKYEADAELGGALKKAKKPSQKASSYNKFVAENYALKKEGRSSAEIFKILGDEWKKMTAEQKSKY